MGFSSSVHVNGSLKKNGFATLFFTSVNGSHIRQDIIVGLLYKACNATGNPWLCGFRISPEIC